MANNLKELNKTKNYIPYLDFMRSIYVPKKRICPEDVLLNQLIKLITKVITNK